MKTIYGGCIFYEITFTVFVGQGSILIFISETDKKIHVSTLVKYVLKNAVGPSTGQRNVSVDWQHATMRITKEICGLTTHYRCYTPQYKKVLY